jgi:transcriptional regulator
MPSELFRAPDPWSIVEASPFATLVALPSGEVAHAPLLLESDRTLIGHVAGTSRLAEALRSGAALLAIFAGPHAYVSPFDYDEAGRDAGRHVPTWNYVAAHVRGRVVPLEEPALARGVLARLGERFDRRGWTDAALPEGYRAGLVAGVLAFRLVPSSVEGVEKLGQNRTPSEREAAARALLARPSEAEQEVGRRMLALR